MAYTELIEHIKATDIAVTSFGHSIYNNLWYADNKNKICITFSPRGGCSIAFQQYLDLVGLLKDGLTFNSFIHNYRCNVLATVIPFINIDKLTAQKYTFIKFIMNPYIRAVSIYRAQASHNLSFRNYLKQLVENKVGYFNENDKYHLEPQYIEGEERIITKYIKINENETYDIKLANGSPYTIDVNRYTSIHHGKKNINNTTFCGDLPMDSINKNLPASYKYFYDDEIKSMVERYYKNDIIKYGFTFEGVF